MKTIIGIAILLLCTLSPQNADSLDCRNPRNIGIMRFLLKADVVFIGEEVTRRSFRVGDLLGVEVGYKVIEPLKGISGPAQEIAVYGYYSWPLFREDDPNPVSYINNKTDLGKDSYELVIARRTKNKKLAWINTTLCTYYTFSKGYIIGFLRSWPYRYRHWIMAMLIFAGLAIAYRRARQAAPPAL